MGLFRTTPPSSVVSKAPRSVSYLLLVGAFLLPQVARAEPSVAGKGITGGALLGAEVVVITEGVVGLETPWLYWLGAGVGAIGGGIGGYYIETGGAPRSSYYLLAGGMALSIPAMIVYLDATNDARHAPTAPEGGPDYDQEPLDELDEASRPPMLAGVPAPIHLERGLRVHPPSVAFEPEFDAFEVAELGAPQSTRVWFPIVSGAF